MKDAERPTRETKPFSANDTLNAPGYVETHPAYAMIGASRTDGGDAVLFGSDFRHRNSIVIRIHHAELRRDLSRDWIHAVGSPMVEVQLSEAQWATFLSTLNRGDGVPCTINWTAEAGQIPAIIPDTERRAQFNREVDETLANAVRLIAEVEEAIEASNLSKKAREDLGSRAAKAKQELEKNLAYAAESFDEHAEKTVEKAKIEVAAYITGAIQRAGLQALGAGEELLQLHDGEPEA